MEDLPDELAKRPREEEPKQKPSKRPKEEDDDFVDDGELDDEATLEAEGDGEWVLLYGANVRSVDDDVNELNELENLAEMPIEELRARFAAGTEPEWEEEEDDDDDDDEEEDEDDGEEEGAEAEE